MKEGDVSLLFLVDRNEDGIYGGLSPQTRFIVKNGKVYWLGAEYTDRNILISEDLRIDGTELEELTSLLR